MGTDSVIYIRTDGNSKIATGHLVRCLCIAQALESFGQSVCFLVSDTDSETLLLDLAASIFQGYSFSFHVKVLETASYDNLELEISELTTLLTDKSIIFIDSYYVTPDYLNFLRKIAKVAYMDDLRAFDYNVDLVINYDVIPNSRESEYRHAYTNADKALLGAWYTPLRTQFQNQNVTLRKGIHDILITTGGSDPYHFAETVVSYLLTQELSVTLHVVVGKLFTNTEALKDLALNNPSVKLHYNVSDMAALMKQCDYAISAAGTTLYELCALGIPAISFTMADNQIIMAETFAETNAIPYAGDIRGGIQFLPHNIETSPTQLFLPQNIEHSPTQVCTVPDSNIQLQTVLTCIIEHLSSLMQNPSKRTAQHQNMRGLVDGDGAFKIAEALCKLQ